MAYMIKTIVPKMSAKIDMGRRNENAETKNNVLN